MTELDDAELRRLRAFVMMLRDWWPEGELRQPQAFSIAREWVDELRQRREALLDPPGSWDSTGDANLDRMLELLEARIDPELSYVPVAGPTRRVHRWVPG